MTLLRISYESSESNIVNMTINNGKLVVSKTANAANPLIENMKPILGCDAVSYTHLTLPTTPYV